MSSGEEDFNERETEKAKESKKRRVQSQRACDRCRLKKVRCNGGQGLGKKCSNCEAYDFDCTYNEATKKRGPSKRLEARLEKMEDLLKKAYPESDDLLAQAGPSQEAQAGGASTPSTDYYSDDDFEPSEVIQQKLSAMCLHPMSNRFFGKSSGVMLLQAALDLKSEYSGVDQAIHAHCHIPGSGR
ncbi:hypothetical protein EWM64_g8828 [Hericium alpestre]|uniref:Zn(2)-C6 fungal-type domain-containing protein n=1 Tax=Hericium alpestre TaxID=135208 RepID=A0A4Y9ZLL5_9AGAM|nr:hypothetical protein EWM64_g8828 [Hericium alpestre]